MALRSNTTRCSVRVAFAAIVMSGCEQRTGANSREIVPLIPRSSDASERAAHPGTQATQRDASAPSTTTTLALAPLAAPRASPSQLSSWTRALTSNDPAEWREALLQLAHQGAAGLDAVEADPAVRAETIRERVLQLLSIALLESATPDDVAHRPWLASFARAKFEEAHSVATARPVSPVVDGVYREGSVSPILASGGFAIPVLLEQIQSANAVERVVAARELVRLDAFTARAFVLALRTDATTVRVGRGDYETTETVTHMIEPSIAARWTSTASRPGEEAEAFVLAMIGPSDDWNTQHRLTSATREYANAFDAPDWDTWWSRSRPVWRAWWSGEHGDQSPEWHDWLAERNGHDAWVMPDANGSAVWTLRVVTPGNARCEIRTNHEVVARGAAPLTVPAPRRPRRTTGFFVIPDYQREYTIDVRLSDGRRTNERFALYAGDQVEIRFGARGR